MSANTHLIAKNREALYDNALIEKYTAGIVLKGYEVKAIKEGKLSFAGAYIDIKDNTPYIVNLYIGKYSKQSASFSDLNANQDRKLLLNAKEIFSIKRELAEKGKTAVPLAFVAQHGLIKLEFAVVKGRREFEKKQVAKDRQILRDLERESKEFRLP
jgi:SsrA-binding protein